MAIKDWSTTAANNNSTPPDGFPEGMTPSSVNNTAREVMAQVRGFYEDPEYRDLGHTPTNTDADTFSVVGDLTGIYHVGRRVRLTDSSTLYGEITATTFSNPNTDIDVTLDSGSISASLTAVAVGFSAQNNPYPGNLDASTLDGVAANLYARRDTGATTGNLCEFDADGDPVDSGLDSSNVQSPTGCMLDWPTATPPTGWFECNGQELDRTTYADLFAIIGSSFGDGNGTTTYNLPDMRGTFARAYVGIADLTFTVNDVTNELTTSANHEFYNDGVPVRVSTTIDDLPDGLVVDTTYYTILVDADTIQLATSYANAIAGTAVDILDTGTGTHTITQWLDPDASTRLDAGNGSTGDNLGTRQDGDIESHSHALNNLVSQGAFGNGLEGTNTQIIVNTSTSAFGGNETRPRNIYLMKIIKS